MKKDASSAGQEQQHNVRQASNQHWPARARLAPRFHKTRGHDLSSVRDRGMAKDRAGWPLMVATGRLIGSCSVAGRDQANLGDACRGGPAECLSPRTLSYCNMPLK